ncbi:MAG: glycoside hydrolase family 3 C-terminal domain-containing protein, partial [Oceanococcus sp.]
TIDERVGNQLRTLFRYGFMDRPAYETNDDAIDKAAHASVAQKTAEQGSVLLQNNGLLPLDTVALSRIAVIGESADRYVNGGGSSAVNPFELHTPLQAIRERVGENISVQFDPGDSAAAAAATAALAELAIVFVTDNASEGEDRPCLNLTCPGDLAQNQDELISAVAAANANTIVVLQTGSAVLTPWRDSTSALLQAWYPGQNGGPAIAAILFGDINPQGKLPLSFPDSESDTPYAGNPAQYPGLPIPGSQGSTFEVQYSEGLFTGYRWYDEQQITPAFPFGYGLSYTQFDYSDLQLSGSPPNLTVNATVSNSGQMAGTEIAQLYVSMPDPSPQITQPPNQLKGFDRISLAPGQSGQVSFPLDARSFSYWDINSSDWQISSGCYRIAVGGHSRDLPISTQLALAGGSCAP